MNFVIRVRIKGERHPKTIGVECIPNVGDSIIIERGEFEVMHRAFYATNEDGTSSGSFGVELDVRHSRLLPFYGGE